MAASISGNPSVFLLMITGQIETVEYPELPDVYCKYCFSFGSDWSVISGIEEGISQVCRPSSIEGSDGIFSLNFPLEITFKSTNPHGWPQLVLSLFGTDAMGNDVIRGYGAVHVPLTPGRHVRKVALFVPEPSSELQRFVSWLFGRRAEFVDPRIVAQASGREVTRVRTQGWTMVSFNVVSKDMKKLGFDVSPRTLSTVSEFPLQLPPAAIATASQPLTEPQLPQQRDEYQQMSEPLASGQALPRQLGQTRRGVARVLDDSRESKGDEDDRPSTSSYTRPVGGNAVEKIDESASRRAIRILSPSLSSVTPPAQEFPERDSK